MLKQGKSVSWKEQQKQREMTRSQPSFLIPLHCLGGGNGELGTEVEPVKKGGVRGRCFNIWFCFLITLL